MKFSFTDEQLMLRESAEGFLSEYATSAAVRQAMASPSGTDEALWQRLAGEMYWPAIVVPEDCGGLGLGMVEAIIVLEQLGRRLAPAPLLASTQSVLALRTVAENPGARALLSQLAQGQIISLAHTAARPHWGLEGMAVSAVQQGQHWRLAGEARFVPAGDNAGTLLVAARIGSGCGLFKLSPGESGLTVTKSPTLDQTRPMATLQLSGVEISEADCLSECWSSQLDTVLNLTRVLVGAEQVGCAQASLDQSVAYVGERVQFGRTIASYQAIKHKAADMMLKVESARSLLCYAACVGDEWLQGSASAQELTEAAAMLASSAGDAAFFCAGTGIQLHGGVGITEEYDIQLFFKRARAMESYLGRPDEHREVIAGLLLDKGDSDAA